MLTMRVAQIARPGGPFELVERPIPQPEADWVRIRLQACGVCHSDSAVKEGLWPGVQYPRVPGHEAVGVVDAVGAGVSQWKPGQRVGVGWHGGTAVTAMPAGAAISSRVRLRSRSRGFRLTAAMGNTWWRPPLGWRWCRRNCRPWKQGH